MEKELTRYDVADRILEHLHGSLSLEDFVAWANNEIADMRFADDKFDEIAEIVSRIGVADKSDFELGEEQYRVFLVQLGCEEMLAAQSAG